MMSAMIIFLHAKGNPSTKIHTEIVSGYDKYVMSKRFTSIIHGVVKHA